MLRTWLTMVSYRVLRMNTASSRDDFSPSIRNFYYPFLFRQPRRKSKHIQIDSDLFQDNKQGAQPISVFSYCPMIWFGRLGLFQKPNLTTQNWLTTPVTGTISQDKSNGISFVQSGDSPKRSFVTKVNGDLCHSVAWSFEMVKKVPL